jgi:hypothetical protein
VKITRVCCQGCGANLEVDETIRFVTCNYCQARLEVVHDASTTHTRVLEEIREDTRRMVDNLRVIELQNDLERLDREWESRKQGFMMEGKHGHRHLPTAAGSIAGGMFLIVGGIVWIGFTVKMGAPAFFPLFGLLFIGMAIYKMIEGSSKAAAHGQADDEFNLRRSSLLREIAEEKRKN